MKYLVEFKSWKDPDSINEQNLTSYYVWGFKANDVDASGAGKFGFESLKGFNNYRATGEYPSAKGLTQDMSLLDWMETDGFAKCEKRVQAAIADDESRTVLENFKEKFPEKYAMFVVFATHDKFPKEYKDDPVQRTAPLDLGKNLKIYAADFYNNRGTTGTPGESTDPKSSGTPPILYPEVKLEIPQDIDTSDFFEFNSWTLSEKFKTWLNENVINPSKEAISKLNPPDGKPKSYLNSLKVTTSSSTIPNGVSPEDKKKHTFAELSDLRAESTIKYLKEELAKIGVLIDGDTKIEKSTKGTNAGKKSTVAYASQPVGTDLTGTSGEEWDKTDANKQALKKYQKVSVEAGIIFNDTKKEEPVKGAETKPEPIKIDPEKPIEVKEKAFFVTITAHKKPKFKLKIRLNIDWNMLFYKLESKKNWGSMACPKFW